MSGVTKISLGVLATFAWLGAGGTSAWAQSAAPPLNFFHVKYIADGAVYLDAGRNAGLQEGMTLALIHPPSRGDVTEAVRFREEESLADLRVLTVADSSSVCEVLASRGELQVGDLAYLTPKSEHQRQDAENAQEAKNYPVIVTFTNGDPLDEEIRETKVPRVMEPIASQIRGRIGFDYAGIRGSGGLNSRQMGIVLRADMTRIGGSYWNFTGYWRGRLNTRSSGSGATTTTLTDLINRTYHLGFYYQNPDSPVTIGVGRLYLPWAPSLSTIDGGYFGRKLTSRVTFGFFGGSTPDPTAWSYNPNQHIAGTFVNYETGDFDHLHLITTEGLAMTALAWHIAREFAFTENTLSFKHYFSLYNSVQADKARVAPGGRTYETGVTQSFTTLRYQPISRLTLSLNHNYFRNLPTFDVNLISTGLLDQYLFQGLSGGFRLGLPLHVTLYSNIGRSKTSTDTAQSWNQLYGATLATIGRTGLRLDGHYSKFTSSFGHGKYTSVSLSKNLTEGLRIEGQGGWQTFISPLTTNTKSHFLNGLVDWNFGPRYFLEAGYTWNMGTSLSYQQWMLTLGYRFGGFRPR